MSVWSSVPCLTSYTPCISSLFLLETSIQKSKKPPKCKDHFIPKYKFQKDKHRKGKCLKYRGKRQVSLKNQKQAKSNPIYILGHHQITRLQKLTITVINKMLRTQMIIKITLSKQKPPKL